MPTELKELSLREITVEDAAAAAELSGELGYPVSSAAMEERIRALKNVRGHVVFVAFQANGASGWIDVGIVHHLVEETHGEIGGLVVASACRSAGIGAQLLKQAESWLREQGITRVVVRSRVTREAAHRFYLREGYERIKTSAVFAKTLV